MRRKVLIIDVTKYKCNRKIAKCVKNIGLAKQSMKLHQQGDCRGTCHVCADLEFQNNKMKRDEENVIDARLPKLKEYKGYDVVIREMIDKEIARQDSNLKWTNAIQIALFPLLFNVFDKKNIFLLPFGDIQIPNMSIVCFWGIMCSIIYIATYMTSEMRINRILHFWNGYCKYTNTTYFDYPPVWGNPVTDNKLKEDCIAYMFFGVFKIKAYRKIFSKAIAKKIYPIITGILWMFLLFSSLLGGCR